MCAYYEFEVLPEYEGVAIYEIPSHMNGKVNGWGWMFH